MKWSIKLFLWKNLFDFPNTPESSMSSEHGFYFQTSCCNKDKSKNYKETWKKTDGFKTKQDYSKFKEHIEKAQKEGKKFATHFLNPTGTNILVVPMPKKGKNFAHFRLFCENASVKQKKEVWKYVAEQVEKALKKSDIIFISTHGKDVPYLHIRIECFPKNQSIYQKQFINQQGCTKYKTTKCNLKHGNAQQAKTA
tara:strand:+ start:2717 stop:3304 length:588 start_codon:yes stop_codon:yes gene_type:complete